MPGIMTSSKIMNGDHSGRDLHRVGAAGAARTSNSAFKPSDMSTISRMSGSSST